MIRILKASAGSGKTFNLAKTYISILLKSGERYAYRGVLAVTFTNKATAEMKNRILKELGVLATDPLSSDYYDDFVPAIMPDAESLKAKSGAILTDILHDYGAFSISTIDKFFQQTLKAFSREIGQFSSYQIELDRNSLVRESVDRILDSLTEDDVNMVKWLNDSVSEQIEQGNKINLEGRLYEMAEKLSNEEHRTLNERYGIEDSDAFSKDRLEAIREECTSIITSFEDKVRAAAFSIIGIMEAAGIPLEETNRKFLLKVRQYAEFQKGESVPCLTDSFRAKASDSSQWFAKAKADRYLPAVEYELAPVLDGFCRLFDSEFKVYNTALLLKGQTFTLGIASEFYKEFDALLKEKNVLGIDDTNTILRRIIDGSDAPFVYEKLGVRYSNFLLDEFQDTSNVQWLNFLPLLRESDSSGNDDLIVGDVKQSIYRWRGSDWDLLDSGVSDEFPDAVTEPLKTNWRSAEKIVRFNTGFFTFASGILDSIGSAGDGHVSRIYSDVDQIPAAKDPQPGYVSVLFCDKDGEMGAVMDAIASVRDRGASWGDISILVRNNKEGGEVASFLIANGIPVLSDDSLDVKTSWVVRRLVALLRCIDNPDDAINAFLISSLDIRFPDRYHSLVDLSEGLLRELSAGNEETFIGEVLYIQSFMDTLMDWTSQNGNNLMYFLKYWDENSFHVSSPADADAVRVLTIHKSKGLEFPVVIFPFAEKVTLSGKSCHWCRPEAEGTGLSLSGQGIYPINMTKDIGNTLFASDFVKERDRQMVDAINTFYVALTRAGKELHVIACTPPEKCRKAVSAGGICDFSDFSQILWAYVHDDSFSAGERYDFTRLRRKSSGEVLPLESMYPSIPINPPSAECLPVEGIGAGESGRLKFNADGADFFGDDGQAGTGASKRLKGIVLHDILASVLAPGDLKEAVDRSVYTGILTPEEGRDVYGLLKQRIESACLRGWFGDDAVRVSNELTIINTDGSLHRPDRIVTHGDGSVTVIDYKFGEEKRYYSRQVSDYVSLLRRMGCDEVSGYLWYVAEDKVVPVCV